MVQMEILMNFGALNVFTQDRVETLGVSLTNETFFSLVLSQSFLINVGLRRVKTV